LEARPAVVVGTSAGATIALDLAVRRPDLVRAVVVHEAAWRALRHPDASGLGALARMQWLAWRGRYPEAAETLLRWVYSYRDGGSAWDTFPEQRWRTARATVEWTMESNLYAQLQRSCTLGRDMGSQAGSHANIAQFENTDINREDARNGHRSGKRSASDCNQANS